jgi:hypothetical protein
MIGLFDILPWMVVAALGSAGGAIGLHRYGITGCVFGVAVGAVAGWSLSRLVIANCEASSSTLSR